MHAKKIDYMREIHYPIVNISIFDASGSVVCAEHIVACSSVDMPSAHK